MREFKYKTSFSSRIKVITPSDEDKYLAVASLKSLKSLIPADADPDDDFDLVYFAGNAAVGGMINLNDDGITNETAVDIASRFVNRFVDIEHNRFYIVGSIISHGFSKYGSNEIISEEEAALLNEPFNIALGGIVWRVVDKDLANYLISAGNENSSEFGSISISWELGFNEYDIVIGSKIISEGIIVPENEKDQYDKYLRANNGPGCTEDGTPVYRVIKNPYPLGIGLVGVPAASVKGVITTDGNDGSPATVEGEAADENLSIENQLDNLKEKNTLEAAASNNIENNLNTENKNSHSENLIVNNNKIMKITNIKDLNDENIKECSASHVLGLISKEIDKISTEFAEKLEAEKAEAKAKEEAAAKLQADLEQAKADFENLKEELAAEKEVRAAEKAQADFNIRMADITSKYELSDKHLQIVAKQIKGLDDVQFAEWLEEFEVLAGSNKKSVATASVETALENANPVNTAPESNATSQEKDLMEKFANAFKLQDILK